MILHLGYSGELERFFFFFFYLSRGVSWIVNSLKNISTNPPDSGARSSPHRPYPPLSMVVGWHFPKQQFRSRNRSSRFRCQALKFCTFVFSFARLFASTIWLHFIASRWTENPAPFTRTLSTTRFAPSTANQNPLNRA